MAADPKELDAHIFKIHKGANDETQNKMVEFDCNDSGIGGSHNRMRFQPKNQGGR